MSGYIEAGYTVVLGTLAVYGGLLVRRERVARRRLGPAAAPAVRAAVGPELAPVPGPDAEGGGGVRAGVEARGGEPDVGP